MTEATRNNIERTHGAAAMLAGAKAGRFFGVSVDADGPRVDEYKITTAGACFVQVVARPSRLRAAKAAATARNRMLSR